jgi:hypothetical protein
MIGQAKKMRHAATTMPQILVSFGASAIINSHPIMDEKVIITKKESSKYMFNIIAPSCPS